ncbi:MAG: Gfo/Idh/MocA family oxidoreductase [Chthoniobacteraceae bacterium]
MTTPLRVALVGIGGFGGAHLSAIECLEREGLMRLVAVADPGSDRFPELKQTLHTRGVRWHSLLADLLKNESDLDAVTIATPIPLHYEMTRACIDQGLFVYLEKPPVPSIQQLGELIEFDTRSRVTAGFQMILSRFVQQLKSMIIEGRLGDLLEIRACACWPRRDNYYNRAAWAGRLLLDGEPVFDGPATNALAHLIHNIMFLAAPGAEEFDVPVEVQGELYRSRPIESYDSACFRGGFRSGVRFTAAFTHAVAETMPFRIEARGTKGWARIAGDGMRFEQNTSEPVEDGENTHDLLLKTHREFACFATGSLPRVSTLLRDTRGYVLATNGMLVSSGGIHDIGAEHIRRYETDGDFGFDVTGMRDAIEETFQTGRLFSEQGVPWAKATQSISLENLHAIDFSKYTVPLQH